MNLHIVLVEPEIPQNTGNIARTCAAIGAKLHLVYPLGFSISEKSVKRAGLDYWDKVEIEEHTSFDEFLKKYEPEKHDMYFVTTKGKHVYSEPEYKKWKKYFCYLAKKQKDYQNQFYKNIYKKQSEYQWEKPCVHSIYQIRFQLSYMTSLDKQNSKA